MKNIIILLAILFISCSSNDNCQEKRDEINTTFDAQVEWVMDNPGPNGVNYTQINNLEAERNLKLEEACN